MNRWDWKEHEKSGIGDNPMITSAFVAKLGNDANEEVWWAKAKLLTMTANKKADWLVMFGIGDDECPPSFLLGDEESGRGYWKSLIDRYQGQYCDYQDIQHIVKSFYDENLH